ncbi:GNAT family N-acetyltransferase [Granulosicoccaceae sp. 1_MG-2023]|nr:GNAT family N-acetyltransferase [Granulosicoccaceae sp. 1_MG-2023]
MMKLHVVPADQKQARVRQPDTGRYHYCTARDGRLDEVFALRYRAYFEQGYIGENPRRRFFDDFDYEPNCRSFLTYFGEQPVGSIRTCLWTPQQRLDIPAMEIFDEEIRREVGYGQRIMETNKFVVSPEFQRRGGIAARFSIYRSALDVVHEEQVEVVVIAVREEHIDFYRLLGFKQISDLRSYPHLNFNTALLACYDLDFMSDFIIGRTNALRIDRAG